MDQKERKLIIEQVHTALAEKGYSPAEQIMGYILTGDPTYITNYHNARRTITALDRHDLLKDIVSNYFSSQTENI